MINLLANVLKAVKNTSQFLRSKCKTSQNDSAKRYLRSKACPIQINVLSSLLCRGTPAFSHKTWPRNLNLVCVRNFSFSTDNVSVEVISDSAIAIMRMHGRPVNSLSLPLMQDSTEALKGLEKSGYKAVILTSSIPKVFCAGLDLKTVAKSNEEEMKKYIRSFNEFIATVYSLKLATVAAIDGAAPAGGCILSLATDYRIITPQGVIGLSEVAIGLPLSSSVIKLCASVMGMRNAELAGLTGEIYKSEKALKMGFVDEVAADSQELMEKAKLQAKIYANIPDINAYYITKMEGRKPVIDLMHQVNRLDHVGSSYILNLQNALKEHSKNLKKN